MENTSQGIETNGKSKTIKFKLTEMSELIENIKKKFIISGSRKNIPILEKNKMYQLGSTNCISG